MDEELRNRLNVLFNMLEKQEHTLDAILQLQENILGRLSASHAPSTVELEIVQRLKDIESKLSQ
jgi:hypothetical protein